MEYLRSYNAHTSVSQRRRSTPTYHLLHQSRAHRQFRHGCVKHCRSHHRRVYTRPYLLSASQGQRTLRVSPDPLPCTVVRLILPVTIVSEGTVEVINDLTMSDDFSSKMGEENKCVRRFPIVSLVYIPPIFDPAIHDVTRSMTSKTPFYGSITCGIH